MDTPRSRAASRPAWVAALVRCALATCLLLAVAPTTVRASWWRDDSVRLPIGSGSLEVTLRPDGGSPLRLDAVGEHRWQFRGATASLVGRSYTVLLRNRSGERLKVVVGVDGLNVYGRETVAGSADGDVGSILDPWTDRSLPGWQLDDARAERFVFSPPEWSEGQGRTDAQIGLVTVQVYRERPVVMSDERERDGSWNEPAGETAAPPAALPAPTERSAQKAEGAAAPSAQARRAPIGTTAGEEVASAVRTVGFDARTTYPEAWAEIDYGTARAALPRPQPRHDEELLGLTLAPARDGARIVAVCPGSAAAQAGLAPSDVIVRLDTLQAPSVADASRILRGKQRGDYAFLRVRRGPHELAVKIRT